MPDADTDLLAEYDRFEREGGVATPARRGRGHRARRRSLPAGPAQPGRRGVARRRARRGRCSSSPPARSTPGCGSTRIEPERYLLDVDAGFGDAVVARLHALPAPHQGRARGAEPAGPAGGPVAEREPVLGDSSAVGLVRRRDRGPGVAGHDVLVRGERRPRRARTPSVTEATSRRYRIDHGVPAMGAELTADTIPAEAGQWLIDASVSFTKGCYTGQELVARIDSRGGNVPRPVRLLVGRRRRRRCARRRGPRRRASRRHGHQRRPAAARPGTRLALAPLARAVDRRRDRRGRVARGLGAGRRGRAPVRGSWPD